MHREQSSATVRRYATALCIGVMSASALDAQTSRTIRVISQASGLALYNAEIINRDRRETLFTDERGEARVPDRWKGAVALRVRQIGYQFLDTTLVLGEPASGHEIVLRRVAYALRTVPVIGTMCAARPDPDHAMLAATALDQLRMAAERYETFRRHYPFRARLERRTKEFTAEGIVVSDSTREEVTSSDDWGERYVPGLVLDRNRRGFSVLILFLAHLADEKFWQRHCFEFNGFETSASGAVLRLRFAPLLRVREPEWSGWVLLDSSTSELRRIEFRLANLDRNDSPLSLEGFTTFMSPTPSIVLPDSTVALWRRNVSVRVMAGVPAQPLVLQLLRLVDVEYRRDRPQPPP